MCLFMVLNALDHAASGRWPPQLEAGATARVLGAGESHFTLWVAQKIKIIAARKLNSPLEPKNALKTIYIYVSNNILIVV